MKTSSRAVPTLGQAIAVACTSLLKDLFGTYRPELHYMRGPGPKWRAKHYATPAVDRPALVATRDLVKAGV